MIREYINKALYTTIYVRFRYYWEWINDQYYNINTLDNCNGYMYNNVNPSRNKTKYDDSCHYATKDYIYSRKVIKLLKIQENDVVYDIGAGMGRFICLMARENVKKCVGIEISEDLCVIARKNAVKLRFRNAPIEIKCCDAATADINDGTVFYLYNPFGINTMTEFLRNLELSIMYNPRKIRIAYANSIYSNVFRKSKYLLLTNEFYTINRSKITFWESNELF